MPNETKREAERWEKILMPEPLAVQALKQSGRVITIDDAKTSGSCF
jgi:hypothetical protein